MSRSGRTRATRGLGLEPSPETTLTSLGLSSIITVRRSEGHPTDGPLSFESLSKASSCDHFLFKL